MQRVSARTRTGVVHRIWGNQRREVPSLARDLCRRGRVYATFIAALACVLLASGCGQSRSGQSTLHAESDQSRKIMHLWWGMLAAAVVVFAGAILLLAIAWRRRNREGLPAVGEDEGVSTGLVIGFGIVIPVTCLVILFFIADIGVVNATSAPKPGQTRMNMTVIGHQWFWEVRYPGTKAVTANEIHIPVKTPVNVTLKSADVIHSFWVPELNKKVDMLPGHPNSILLYADSPGIYRGQCAEFCGLQHANMSMAVYVDPPAKFKAWLANMSRPLAPPASPLAKAGENVFMTEQCASCHAIRGTAAVGTIGPDLTHLATRRTLAALMIPNDRAHLTQWVDDPQSIKPGNKMPQLGLSPQQLRQVVAFMQGLR
jgi:cytochrome c oxidase subunit 2